ncbi:scaffolding protein [Microbacterium phage Floof]|uniref:Scaffolding protein n=1 Tax=Microbacterium phage Floof TaxID=2201433 RepID=A0A2Z4Q403_9CAUD|nr:scaffolding protein [Microbacterium phage Floof]
MSDAQNPAAPASVEAPAEPSKETPAAETPPWGDDFDPARAWETIQRQRASETDLKTKLSAYEKAEQEKADAELTELEKLRKDFAALAAEKTALARTTQLNELGLDKALHGFITGETPEDIAKQVTALKAALGTPDPAADPAPVTTRPQPKLTPGQGGDDKSTPDLDALVASLR